MEEMIEVPRPIAWPTATPGNVQFVPEIKDGQRTPILGGWMQPPDRVVGGTAVITRGQVKVELSGLAAYWQMTTAAGQVIHFVGILGDPVMA